MADGGRKSEGATAASREGEAMVGCSPASLSSPLSGGGNGGDGDGASSNGAFEPECSLDRFMETLDALSPDGQQLHVNKRQVRILHFCRSVTGLSLSLSPSLESGIAAQNGSGRATSLPP